MFDDQDAKLCDDPSITGCTIEELADGHGNNFLQNVCCDNRMTSFQCPFGDNRWYIVNKTKGILSLKCPMDENMNSTLGSYQTCGAIEGSYCGDPVCEKQIKGEE